MRLTELRGPQDAADTHEAWRQRLAPLLRWSSAWLERATDSVKRRMTRVKQAYATPELELYAEASAPEGALVIPLLPKGQQARHSRRARRQHARGLA